MFAFHQALHLISFTRGVSAVVLKYLSPVFYPLLPRRLRPPSAENARYAQIVVFFAAAWCTWVCRWWMFYLKGLSNAALQVMYLLLVVKIGVTPKLQHALGSVLGAAARHRAPCCSEEERGYLSLAEQELAHPPWTTRWLNYAALLLWCAVFWVCLTQ
jgi:hypothetical protein